MLSSLIVKKFIFYFFRNSNYGTTWLEEYHCHSDELEHPNFDKHAIRVLWASVALCLFFMICEIVGGILAHSLAIATDAAHLVS